MKKVGKKILKVLGIILLALVGLCIIGFIVNRALRRSDMAKLENAYGQRVETENQEFNVEIQGSGDKVIILMPALADVSPVLEYRQLAGSLRDEYTVVTVEYPGYGLAKETKKERSIENITKELHQCIQKLGYDQYYLSAHSISGIYALYYANQYENEVKGFIGIDTSVPKQNDETDTVWMQQAIEYLGRAQNEIGLTRLLSKQTPYQGVPEINGYEWSDEEIELWRLMNINVSLNNTALNEANMLKQNFETVRDLKFPASIPVLNFLASSNCEMMPAWEPLHRDIITNQGESQVYILEGEHYLYYTYGDEIAEKIKAWIK